MALCQASMYILRIAQLTPATQLSRRDVVTLSRWHSMSKLQNVGFLGQAYGRPLECREESLWPCEVSTLPDECKTAVLKMLQLPVPITMDAKCFGHRPPWCRRL
jgi:hypothetical protein